MYFIVVFHRIPASPWLSSISFKIFNFRVIYKEHVAVMLPLFLLALSYSLSLHATFYYIITWIYVSYNQAWVLSKLINRSGGIGIIDLLLLPLNFPRCRKSIWDARVAIILQVIYYNNLHLFGMKNSHNNMWSFFLIKCAPLWVRVFASLPLLQVARGSASSLPLERCERDWEGTTVIYKIQELLPCCIVFNHIS